MLLKNPNLLADLEFTDVEAFREIAGLFRAVQRCDLCARMLGCRKVLSHKNGGTEARLMFIGEAPGRLGAERTGIPFFGDRSGQTFEYLLRFAGLSRESVFVTNAVLCNPRDNKGLNDKPSRAEVSNCSFWLRNTILVVDPVVVVTLGSVALEALKLIERHDLKLRENVGRVASWFNRHLIPLYHPGPRALIHRDIEAQKKDYGKLKRFLRSSGASESK